MIRMIIFSLCISSAFAKDAPVFTYPKALEIALETAKEAGNLLLEYWNRDVDLETQIKGSSPVTIGDLRSNELICKKLLTAFPEFGLITEEKVSEEIEHGALSRWREAEWTWVIDPLDGTRSFIAGKKEFGIHIGLMHFGVPVLGVNHYPVLKTTYFAMEGCGAYKQVKKKAPERIFVEKSTNVVRPVISSRKSQFVHSFYSRLLKMPITQKMLRKDFKIVGSCGLRLCLIAEGTRNIYASSGESGRIWDFASGSVILKEAGGFISDLEGNALDFLSSDFKLKSGVLSCGPKDLFERSLK
ncbi:MAG TPA: 3'(2'),5'-bisphosphate nucleotidase CysQ [Chlamydiales bacterium]|nr:3'(2'),5'-bisphosphate nucleotidase CysQ [Chlamydiales bacterium]